MNNTQEIPLTNQTQFMGEEPLLSRPTSPPPAIPQPENLPEEEKVSFFRSRKGRLLLAGGVILILLMGVVSILVLGNKKTPTQRIAEEMEEAVNREISPLQEKIDLLKIQLEGADPTKQSLAFPPVDLDLEITDK